MNLFYVNIYIVILFSWNPFIASKSNVDILLYRLLIATVQYTHCIAITNILLFVYQHMQ